MVLFVIYYSKDQMLGGTNISSQPKFQYKVFLFRWYRCFGLDRLWNRNWNLHQWFDLDHDQYILRQCESSEWSYDVEYSHNFYTSSNNRWK